MNEPKQPSQYELAQLAASLYPKTEYRYKDTEKRAIESVRLASRIWIYSGIAINSDDGLSKDKETLSILTSPLKVGNHYMPEIPAQFFGRHVDFEKALELVIGLAKKEDRLKWFRAFLTSQPNNFSMSFACIGMGGGFHANNPFITIGANTEKAFTHAKEHGFSNLAPFSSIFREWRLTMKTPTKPNPHPVSLEEAIAAGIAEMQKSKK